MPQIETHKVAFRGLFAKLHFQIITDRYERGFHERERLHSESDEYLISVDLFLDDTFSRLLAEDISAPDMDDETLAELLAAPYVRTPASDALTQALKDICVGHQRSVLAELGV